MVAKSQPATTLKERASWICNTLFHQITAIVSIFIFWTVFYNGRLDNILTWHMFLNTLSYVPLMGEAIILFSTDNVWSLKMERKTRFAIHGAILFTSAVLVTVGISLEINSKTGKHFQSTHAWTGLLSWILVAISQILGVAAAKAQAISALIPPVYVKFLHIILGLLGYIFGIVSLCYGLSKHSISAHTSQESRTAIVWILAIATTWSILGALRSVYNQIKTIASSTSEAFKKINL